jgi:flagella basal body P-ring formation protein FlgA
MKLIATLSFILLATSAAAAPVLRSDVVVTDAIVTVGDMFIDAGELAERPLFRAPAPGTTGNVTLEDVRAAALAVGLNAYDAAGVVKVRVARAGTLVDDVMLTTLLTDDLGSRGIVTEGVDVVARFAAHMPLLAAAAEPPVSLIDLRYTPANGAFAMRIRLAGQELPVDVRGTIELMVEAPHLVGTEGAGTILSAEDIEMRLVPLRKAEASGVARVDQLVGKQLTRQSRGGIMLRLTDVTEPRVVERNSMVTVILEHGPMTLSIRGQALNSAAAGEQVQVLNPTSRKILHGLALPNGAVELSTTLALAGL